MEDIYIKSGDSSDYGGSLDGCSNGATLLSEAVRMSTLGYGAFEEDDVCSEILERLGLPAPVAAAPEPAAEDEPSGRDRAGKGRDKHECPYCSYKTLTKSHLLIHINIHTKEHSFSCELCKFTTNHLRSLKRHLAQQHRDPLRFPCHVCLYSARTKLALHKHLKTHNKA